MRFNAGRALGLLAMLCVVTLPTRAQEAVPDKAAVVLAKPGRELTMSKCFQCHTEAMWRDQRIDARAWEATLYRMLARGAVWTDDEIKTMATFLAADYGPNAPKSEPMKR